MAFVALHCPSCGAEITLDDTRDFGFCSYCGTKVVQEKQIIEHRGSISIDRSQEINNLLIRARDLTIQNRFSEAGQYYNRVLDIDASNVEAKEGLLRAESIITEPNLFIKRLPAFCGCEGKVHLKINGQKTGVILNGGERFFQLPVGQHELTFKLPGNGKNPPVTVMIASKHTKIDVELKVKWSGKIAAEVKQRIQ